MDRTLTTEYDVVIVGAGPAGLRAALRLGQEGRHSVALIDRRSPWREPVACAEAVLAHTFQRILPEVRQEWIRTPVNQAILHSPDGTRVSWYNPGGGLLIDRARLHHDLAVACRAVGVHCSFKTRATALSRLEGGFRRLRCEGEFNGEIRARVVIDATGPGSGFGRDENIVRGDHDLEPTVFAHVEDLPHEPDAIQLFFGRTYAPGGYAWVFPRDGRTANVGVVLGKRLTGEANARRAFLEFMQRHFPNARIGQIHGGIIPCGTSDKPLAVDGLFKAGDAASMVNPISRSGIVEALTSGLYAAEGAIDILPLRDEAERRTHYRRYRARWEKTFGGIHTGLSTAKKAFTETEDSALDRMAHAVARIPADKMSGLKVLWAVALTQPMLLWRLRGMVSRRGPAG